MSILDRWLSRNPLPGPDATKEEKSAFYDRMPGDVRNEWNIRKAAKGCCEPGYNSGLAERAAKRMQRVDAMPPPLRAVVYEYGLEIVQQFLDVGVKTPSHIKLLIDTVLHADLPGGQPRFKINKGPNAKRNPAELEDEYWSIPQVGIIKGERSR